MDPLLYQSIVSTLSYADVFDYPLTKGQLWQRLIGYKINKQAFIDLLSSKKKLKNIEKKGGLYFLSGRKDIIYKRRKRRYFSNQKLEKAKKIAEILKLIPTISLLGLSGTLSSSNAKKNDDIDIFFVTSQGRVWTTRFLATLTVDLFGKRRKPKDLVAVDKFCLNMFVDEGNLEILKKDRNLYLAYEIVQMKPLWYKGDIYQKFLAENLWVKKYLPNALRITPYELPITRRQKKKNIPNYLTSQLLNCLESFFKIFQLWYMKSRRTNEFVSDHLIKFHPEDAKTWVIREYRKRLEKLRV